MNNRLKISDEDIAVLDFNVLVATCVGNALFDGMDSDKPFVVNVLIDPVNFQCQIRRDS